MVQTVQMIPSGSSGGSVSPVSGTWGVVGASLVDDPLQSGMQPCFSFLDLEPMRFFPLF